MLQGTRCFYPYIHLPSKTSSVLTQPSGYSTAVQDLKKMPTQNTRSRYERRPPTAFPFLKLPPELRNKIYKLALRYQNNFHNSYMLIWMEDMHHAIQNRIIRHHSYGILWAPPRRHPNRHEKDNRIIWTRRQSAALFQSGRIGLLLSCRQVYAEAVGFLYSSNIYSLYGRCSFWNSHSMSQAAGLIVPPHFQSRIRLLELQWRFSQLPTSEAEMMTPKQDPLVLNRATWPDVCHAVENGMTGLRVLFVTIEVSEAPEWNVGDEMHWIVPMLRIKGLTTCKVFLSSFQMLESPLMLEDLGNVMSGTTPAPFPMRIQKPLDHYPVAQSTCM